MTLCRLSSGRHILPPNCKQTLDSFAYLTQTQHHRRDDLLYLTPHLSLCRLYDSVQVCDGGDGLPLPLIAAAFADHSQSSFSFSADAGSCLAELISE